MKNLAGKSVQVRTSWLLMALVGVSQEGANFTEGKAKQFLMKLYKNTQGILLQKNKGGRFSLAYNYTDIKLL